MQSPYGGYGPNPFAYPPPVPPPKRSGGVGLIVAGVLLVVFLLGLIVAGSLFFSRKKASRSLSATATTSSGTWSDLDSPVPVSSDDPMRGDRNALVTIVVFSEFQCPFCKRYAATLDDVRAHYGNDVRIIWKNDPLAFHPNARPAAEAARGVFMLGGNTAFWTFHDQAFANQSSLDETHYESWATLAGVDSKAIHTGMLSSKWATKIDDDHVLASTLSVSGTPASFIDGILVSGAQPLTEMEKVIDGELPKARARLASGTAPDRVYVEVSKANFVVGGSPSSTATAAPPVPTSETIYKVPVGTSPVRGATSPLVTIVEFSDFQCPFCARAEPTLDRIRTDYPKDVRIVWKNKPLPFHTRALPAAELALEARAEKGDAGFWSVHDAMFADQTHLEDADLLALARRSGVNDGKVSTAILTKKYKADIDADDTLGNGVGASGTPTFYINGRQLVGAQPYNKFKDLIDDEIKNANAALASGTATRSTLYDTMTARGTIGAGGGSGGGGVLKEDTVIGTGPMVKNGDMLTTHYTGTLADGTKFDSSRDRGTPFTFTLGAGMVIKGWDQGMVGMRVGGRRKLTIPPELAYGHKGAPPQVPPDATLIFDVELLAIK